MQNYSFSSEVEEDVSVKEDLLKPGLQTATTLKGLALKRTKRKNPK